MSYQFCFKRKNPVRMTKIARKSDKLLSNIKKKIKRNRHLKIEISKEFHFKRVRRTKIEGKFDKFLFNIKEIKRTRHLIMEIS